MLGRTWLPCRCTARGASPGACWALLLAVACALCTQRGQALAAGAARLAFTLLSCCLT
jgi:hypothetical protein